jgi:hypothetical protein
MMKAEFEALALRGNAEIGPLMYENIERFYTSENDYKAAHGIGGIYENKRDFVRRVFGGKVNTPKTIAEKIARESMKENRWALRGTPTGENAAMLKEMDEKILDHYMQIYLGNW